ncbi:MAG: ATP-binding cassette domain-containing protein [Actinobacteria bacterium]|nr:ATP-binding cassette domain-containing protein [Actinomycetota bacterium]
MIEATGLVKHYGTVHALDGLDLSVPAGTVLGLLGPNGAGKTTAVRILTTLLRADAGSARVAGADVMHDAEQVRRRIGLSGQYAAVDEYLTGFENLTMVGRLYGLPKATARRRADELLERFDLVEVGRRPTKTYSGGLRRRLDLAAALVAAPPVLVLDEPTTGLDPRSRLAMWEVIRELVTDGATLLLTTQYLEEADRLADDIVVIDHGTAIAHGTADQLKTMIGGERVELVLADAADREGAQAALAAVGGGEVLDGGTPRELSTAAPDGARSLAQVLADLATRGIEVLDIGLRRPTLDDVFLTLTGHVTEDGAPPAGGAGTASAAGTRRGRRRAAAAEEVAR